MLASIGCGGLFFSRDGNMAVIYWAPFLQGLGYGSAFLWWIFIINKCANVQRSTAHHCKTTLNKENNDTISTVKGNAFVTLPLRWRFGPLMSSRETAVSLREIKATYLYPTSKLFTIERNSNKTAKRLALMGLLWIRWSYPTDGSRFETVQGEIINIFNVFRGDSSLY